MAKRDMSHWTIIASLRVLLVRQWIEQHQRPNERRVCRDGLLVRDVAAGLAKAAMG